MERVQTDKKIYDIVVHPWVRECFLVCYDTTQLATQLQQRRIQGASSWNHFTTWFFFFGSCGEICLFLSFFYFFLFCVLNPHS